MSIISCKQYSELCQDGLCKTVDVREQDEWNAGHLDGAEHIPLKILEFVAEERLPDKNQKIVMCCAHGGRAAVGADILRKLGYTDVVVLDGGYMGYCETIARK